jgi:hypothetical protein
MLTYAVIIAMGLAGYFRAPWWLALAGGAALTIGAWGTKLLHLGRESGAAWSTKTRTYFITGAIVDIVLCALCLGAGRIVRALLAG